ncbi:Ankyrin repeat domain-containing protein [Plasmodiophora brassicae]|uniref:Uncharacterized protein n=1 Tax=Plasmodiophora brassicae TaxID=37360 RepID=A0A0G4IY62_PLABS|nr:hypothetical protein PBRA_007813 [Plasmodiophora brassicae]SPR00200.1 unnamed protein product [Plasmodiophora brassicae]
MAAMLFVTAVLMATASAAVRPCGFDDADRSAPASTPMAFSSKLSTVAAEGWLSKVQRLIRSDASLDVNAQDEPSGWAALHAACHNGQASVVQALLERGADPNIQTNDRRTPLHLAVLHGQADIVRMLMGATLKDRIWMAVVRTTRDYADHSIVDQYGYTPLLYAVKLGHGDIVDVLLAAGADPTARNSLNGWTAMHYAAAGGHATLISALHGRVDASARSWRWRCTALHHAVLSNSIETVRRVARVLPSPSVMTSSFRTALIDAGDEHGRSALMMAARYGEAAMVTYLLSAGAKLAAQDNVRSTVLHAAACNPTVDVLVRVVGWWKAPSVGGIIGSAGQILRRPTLDVVNASGRTPFHEAAAIGLVKNVELLLGAGASIDRPDSRGQTALHQAARFGHPDVVKLLLASGAHLGIVDRDRRTALHYAAEGGHVDAVRVLIANDYPSTTACLRELAGFKGRPLDYLDAGMESALSIAGRLGHTAVEEVLLDAGALTRSERLLRVSEHLIQIWISHVLRHTPPSVITYLKNSTLLHDVTLPVRLAITDGPARRPLAVI